MKRRRSKFAKFLLWNGEVCVLGETPGGVTYLIPVRYNDLWWADFTLASRTKI